MSELKYNMANEFWDSHKSGAVLLWEMDNLEIADKLSIPTRRWFLRFYYLLISALVSYLVAFMLDSFGIVSTLNWYLFPVLAVVMFYILDRRDWGTAQVHRIQDGTVFLSLQRGSIVNLIHIAEDQLDKVRVVLTEDPDKSTHSELVVRSGSGEDSVILRNYSSEGLEFLEEIRNLILQ